MKNTLLRKWQENSLGHFYLIQGDEQDTAKFIDDFLKEITPSPTHHPDILFIHKNPDKKNYSFESDFSQLFDFIKFSALKLPQKIIILPQAHLLTTDISNKILGTLEELRDGVCFFLCPTQFSLLPTIRSRAITLRVPKSNKDSCTFHTTDQFRELLKAHGLYFENFLGLSNFLDSIKEDGELQTEIFNQLLTYESNHLSSFQQKDQFLKEVRRFQTSLTLNNLYKERFVALLSTCQV